MHMQLRFARSLAPRSMAAADDITAVLQEFVEEETAAQAQARPTAEDDATATTAVASGSSSRRCDRHRC